MYIYIYTRIFPFKNMYMHLLWYVHIYVYVLLHIYIYTYMCTQVVGSRLQRGRGPERRIHFDVSPAWRQLQTTRRDAQTGTIGTLIIK